MNKFALLLCLLITLVVEAQMRPVLPLQKHAFTVIAHRGDHVEVPENTLAAFEKAIQHDADYVEVDLRTSNDGALVIMHDATLDRMTNGKGKLAGFTYAALRMLQIKPSIEADTNLYTIPSFDEVLDLCKNRTYIYLDFKDASVRQAYNAISRHGMQNQVIVYINSPQQYKDWCTIAPQIPLIVSVPDTIKTADEMKAFIAANRFSLLDGDYSDYNNELFNAAHNQGVVVWPDIQGAEECKNWDKAIALGFKGLQTDHPEDLIKYLHQKGLR